ncbi:GNAT family N-acetyltransferase [Candidatus Gottesmanbacteria bacterium]|nr:GNAT family N-acetyltransferase [Candidatus Gottesmanbacteria bacterium]
MKLLIKTGKELTDSEFEQITQAHLREFKEGPSNKSDLGDNHFFLLKAGEKILAAGILISVQPVNFNKEIFSILGIGGIIANERGKGYGKKIMLAVRKYLAKKNISGVGFCGEYNSDFYQKCGFQTDRDSIRRFIYYENGKRIENKSDDFVLYWNSSDNFMKKVLANKKTDIILPRPPNW